MLRKAKNIFSHFNKIFIFLKLAMKCFPKNIYELTSSEYVQINKTTTFTQDI